MKPKSYKVLLIAYAMVVVIDAESEEKAIEYAQDVASPGDYEVDEVTIECELKTQREIKDAKRHAQAVSEPDDMTA